MCGEKAIFGETRGGEIHITDRYATQRKASSRGSSGEDARGPGVVTFPLFLSVLVVFGVHERRHVVTVVAGLVVAITECIVHAA